MFGIGAGEMVVILVIALLIVGPEKLPGMVRDGTRWVRDLRRMVDATRRDLTDTIGPELRDLGIEDMSDLNPRQYLRRHVLDGIDDDDEPTREDERGRRNGSGSGSRSGSTAAPRSRHQPTNGTPPAYDTDAT